jgi:hypothetical protein
LAYQRGGDFGGERLNNADDNRTFLACAKDDGSLSKIIVQLTNLAQCYWATYGGESLSLAVYNQKTGQIESAKYHAIDV